VFSIRPNVAFTDGSPVTAEAVKAHYERARVDQRQSHYLSAIESIDVTGDLEVTFNLSGPFSALLHFLALGVGGVSAPSSLGPTEDMARNPVGTGPFMLESWEGQSTILVPNPDYWGEKPLLDQIEFRYIADESTRLAALEAGEIDVAANVPPAEFPTLDALGLNAVLTPYAQTFWLGFTQGSSPILDDVRVRRAIAMVTDNESLVDGVTEGLTRRASGFLPPELGITSATPITGSVDEAKALLADAGHPNGFEISLSSPIGRYLKDVEITQVVQAQLATIGITANINTLEYAAFADGMRAHQMEMFVLGWRMQASPDPYFRAVFLSTSTSNWSAYNDPEIDAMLDDAATASTLEEANRIYHEMDQKLIDDAAGVPIYYTNNLTGVAPTVHDLVVDPIGNYRVEKTWVE
jgi:peptide/nickel transport system substrate-binding protein